MTALRWSPLLSLAGCAALHASYGDHDGDGSYVPADCDDLDASIHPGAMDVAGDGIDQDCDGTDAGPSTADTDPTHTDAPDDSDVDSDGVVDTGSYTGPCAPPDRWTGGVDPALYTRAPYPETYDAGVADVAARATPGSSSSGGTTTMIVRATVVAVTGGDVWVADGRASVHLQDNQASPWTLPVLGDEVIVGVNGSSSSVFRVGTTWTITGHGRPVSVHELGAAKLDHQATTARLVHAWGQLVRPSSLNCGNSAQKCFVFTHGGVEDKVRVPSDNDYGLDADYRGGLCAEVVAPVAAGLDGNIFSFLDVADPTWMRVWPAP